mmetsp:Transcript_79272/g.128463  ORF Transcript_79272/g.128463 Transcript_79272/m.128463 type:complete len:288 (-) Transcript_79272:1345-2208(-)
MQAGRAGAGAAPAALDHFLHMTDRFNRAFMSKYSGLEDELQPVSSDGRLVHQDFAGARGYYAPHSNQVVLGLVQRKHDVAEIQVQQGPLVITTAKIDYEDLGEDRACDLTLQTNTLGMFRMYLLRVCEHQPDDFFQKCVRRCECIQCVSNTPPCGLCHDKTPHAVEQGAVAVVRHDAEPRNLLQDFRGHSHCEPCHRVVAAQGRVRAHDKGQRVFARQSLCSHNAPALQAGGSHALAGGAVCAVAGLPGGLPEAEHVPSPPIHAALPRHCHREAIACGDRHHLRAAE